MNKKDSDKYCCNHLASLAETGDFFWDDREGRDGFYFKVYDGWDEEEDGHLGGTHVYHCPFCGEHVSLKAGKCPACGTAVEAVESKDAAKKVAPVVRSENVVFLHLDVETGELNYLQKLAHRLGLGRVSVKLDGIGKGGFEESWSSLSRV
jgi:methionyl-tRNA synthetase